MSDFLAFLKPDETAAQLIARTHVDPINTGLVFASIVKPGQVLEISGPSGAAKTEILAQVVATTILPRRWGPAFVGGRQENVVLFDLDRKFDVLRLVHILGTRLRLIAQRERFREQQDVAHATEECLQRLQLVQCSSSFSFLAALKTCGPLFTSLQAEGGLKLLLVDNVAAFHALDRASKSLPDYVMRGSADAQLSLQQAHGSATAELHALARRHRLAVIATRHSGAPPGAGFDREEAPDIWLMRDNLPKAWQDFVTMRLLVRGPMLMQQGGACFAVKWHMPGTDSIQRFAVTDGGLVSC